MEDIFGPDLRSINGNVDRSKPNPVEVHYIKVPLDIMEKYKEFSLTSDIVFVSL